MISSIKTKQFNPAYAITSATSSVESQISVKKKLFTRKPSNANISLGDKKRKGFAQPLVSSTYVQQSCQLSKDLSQTSRKLLINRTDRFNQSFITQRQQSSKSLNRQRSNPFYSPKTQQKNMFNTSFYLLNKLNKNYPQYPSSLQVSALHSLNHSFSKIPNNQPKSKINKEGVLKEERSLTHNRYNRSANSLNHSFIITEMSKSKQGSISKKAEAIKQLSIQCQYCLNSKKIVDILNQKYFKLEEQYNHKHLTMKQLIEQNQKLSKQNNLLRQQLEQYQQKLSVQEGQWLKQKEQLTLRIDSFKKDLLRLNQKLKYNQIENVMLLRIKNQHLQMSKQYDKLKNQHEFMKRQIFQSARLSYGNFSKTKITKQLKNIHTRDKISNKDGGSKRLVCNQSNSIKSLNMDYDQDDNISLNFSQHSQDHF